MMTILAMHKVLNYLIQKQKYLLSDGCHRLIIAFGLFLLTLLPVTSTAQVLVLTNQHSGQRIYITMGEEFFFRSSEHAPLTCDRIIDMNDSLITTYNYTIPIDEVHTIAKAKRNNPFRLLLGGTLVGIGTVWSYAGYVFFLNGVSSSDWVYLVGGIADAIIGKSIALAGVLLLRKRKKLRKMEEGWRVEVRLLE